MYYVALPFGYAFGAAIGGLIVDSHLYTANNGDNQSWRLAFIGLAIISLPFITVMGCMKSPPNMSALKRIESKSNHYGLSMFCIERLVNV